MCIIDCLSTIVFILPLHLDYTKVIILNPMVAQFSTGILAHFSISIYNVTLNDVSENDILETFGLNEKGMIKKLVGYNWENALDDFYVIYEQMHIMCPRPFDGITELIEKLKKKSILIALVTGKGEKSCAITLRQFNMDTCFDKVKTGNPFKNNKAENFRELLADYKLQPDEMIYIGDTVSDIVSCREVGIRCLSASWITSCLDAQKLEAHNAGNVFYSIASLECYLMG